MRTRCTVHVRCVAVSPALRSRHPKTPNYYRHVLRLDVGVVLLPVSRLTQIVLSRSERDREAFLPLTPFVHNPHGEFRGYVHTCIR